MKKLLIILILPIPVTVYAVSAPTIHDVPCNGNVIAVWSNPSVQPRTNDYSGSLYVQQEGKGTYFYTLQYKTKTGNTYYYELDDDERPEFLWNKFYRLNGFIIAEGTEYWFANGNTWWIPCQWEKFRIRMPLVIRKGE